MPTIKIELKDNLRRADSENPEIKKHEKFGSSQIGNDLERKQLVDAMDDTLNKNLKEYDRISFPKTIYSNTPFQDNGFEILKQYSGMLENDEFLMKLAKLIAKHNHERVKYEKGLIEQIEIEVKTLSNKPKGPVLICVDTGGSMRGNSERIAKTITFALAKISLEDKRGCYLISFSNGIQIVDMKNFKGGDSLLKLVEFLRLTFGGKKNFRFILEYALNFLQSGNLRESDVLIVSDSNGGKLSEELKGKILSEQEKNTCFYSLAIGKGDNSQLLDGFDAKWNYNPKDKNAQKELVRQLDMLRKRTL